jgi:hypothetical protein
MKKSFFIWRLAFFFQWAKSGTWEITKEDTKRTLYFAIQTVTRNEQNMHGLIIGPAAFYIAYVGED